MTVVRVRQESKWTVSSEIHSFFLHHMVCCRDFGRKIPAVGCVDDVLDGYSGTSTSRPAFQRLIQDAQDGKVKTIIVKDFSRFARDYIEAGDYMERIFPLLGVRFISVNDGYDSGMQAGRLVEVPE